MRFLILTLAFAFVSVPAFGQQVCRNGRCTSQPRTQAYTTYAPAHVYGGTSTAQGVAELQASRGYMSHFGGNAGYEGVGTGNTPEQALNNCCYSRNGWAVVDQGVARGRNGRWYACKRYAR